MFLLSSYVWSIILAESWWDNISSLIYFSSIVSLLVIIIDSVSVSAWKVMSVLNKLLVWTLIRGRSELTKTFALFSVFKLFDSIMLMCESTLIHLLFLDLYETYLTCYLLDDANAMTVYFTFIKYCISTIKIKLENWYDVQCHEHQALIYRVINMMIDLIVFIK